MTARALIVLFAALLMASHTSFAQERARNTPKLTDEQIRVEKRLYRQAPEGDLYLHVYFPPDWQAEDARPVIVFFFGGGWSKGSYRQFDSQAQYFASRGLVAASADYRIRSIHQTTPDQAVQDARSALRWVRTHARELGADANKIIAAGGSAGGHLAASTALLNGFDAPEDDVSISCRPSALVLFNPALDLTRLVGFRFVDHEGNDIARELSPTFFLNNTAPPAILFYGTADKFLDDGEQFVSAARNLGVRTELHLAADAGHGFFNRSPYTELTAALADEFLASLGYLQGAPTVKLPEDSPQLEKR